MDTGLGYMTPISEKKAEQIKSAFSQFAGGDIKNSLKKEGDGIFKIGELVVVKDSIFRITNISKKKLTLTIISESEKEALEKRAIAKGDLCQQQ